LHEGARSQQASGKRAALDHLPLTVAKRIRRRWSQRKSVDGIPGTVRVVFGDGSGNLCRVGPNIFLVDNTVLMDDEGHDAGVAILGRVGQECEAARKDAIDHAVTRPAFLQPSRPMPPMVTAKLRKTASAGLQFGMEGPPGQAEERLSRIFIWRLGLADKYTLRCSSRQCLKVAGDTAFT